MNQPHLIRLRGPWQFQTLADSTPHATGRIELPGDLNQLVADYEGTVRFSRRFHKPTGIDSGTRVDLVILGLPDKTQLDINGHVEAARPDEHRMDITGRLQPTNEIMLEFPVVSGQAVQCEVRLEITSPA
jgi:hypothetical protein